MDRESVPAQEIQPEVERRESSTVAPHAPNERRQYLVFIGRMNVCTSVCARTADEAAITLGLKDDGRNQVMLAHDISMLHDHFPTGTCKLYYHASHRVGSGDILAAWQRYRDSGREASRY